MTPAPTCKEQGGPADIDERKSIMKHWPDSERRYFTTDDMIPYFRSRAKQKRICPECHKAALNVRPTALNPNGAFDYCPECHYFQVIIAPEEAQVPIGWQRERSCKIIRLDFGQQKNR